MNTVNPGDAVGAARCLAQYAAAVDARDPERIVALLAPDVRLSRGSATGEALETFAGVEAFLEAYRPFLDGPARGSRHALTNLVVETVDPDRVIVRSCFEATMFNETGTRRVFGRYDDELVRDGDSWLIAHKRNVMEWAVDLPPAIQL